MKTVTLLLLLSILGVALVCAEVHAEDQYTENADVVAVDDSAAGSRRIWASWKHKYNANFNFDGLKADIEVSQTHWDQYINTAKWSSKFTEFNDDICPGGQLNWHVHQYPVSQTAWDGANIRDVAATGNAPGCDASITGGHYDPTFACGGASQNNAVNRIEKAQIEYFASESTAEKPAESGNVGPYSPTTVTGPVTASTTEDGELELTWDLSGLEPNASGGIHVHYGTTCESEVTVKGDAPTGANAGHYYFPPAAGDNVDPWANVKWGSNDAGNAYGSVRISKYALGPGKAYGLPANSAYNRVVIVHNAAGGKVGCGLLEQHMQAKIGYFTSDSGVLKGGLPAPYLPTTVTGAVTASTTKDGKLALKWSLSGLELSSKGGIHIHYGNKCESEATVKGDAPTDANLGHYYDPAKASVDPWTVEWASTEYGNAHGSVEISKDALGAAVNSAYNRVVIVHNAAGGKVGCGVLARENLCNTLRASDQAPAGKGNGRQRSSTVQGPYMCSPDNQSQCEIGDQSGKMGKLDASNRGTKIKWDRWMEPITNLAGRSMVLHCCSGAECGARLACANLELVPVPPPPPPPPPPPARVRRRRLLGKPVTRRRRRGRN